MHSDLDQTETICIGESLETQATAVLDRAKALGLQMAFAESCTGGLLAGTLTAIPGSSAVVDRCYVTYSNRAKTEMLGVPAELIAAEGAVSKAVSFAMLEGVLERSGADVGLSITGIAGPGGQETEKPVGLVYLAAARRGEQPISERMLFGDAGRTEVRSLSVDRALKLLASILD
ncbi:Nicotinamide-nucleotide amidohydrolase PncC [Methyloligella halotolerans]|uniref:Nicotinamide-nucleotide amidohydrolase PncC n=1 Tax=Methyloligella halotolerans TaxID=1177755 RepID=A0A1E2S1X7_9HYPH|nr:CinA family protein [Methyloligella halotolerans]ODA68444.1 Nicotinamide-nucleotide amidohydrolase PncC [Methyloligella halotolerans]